MTRRYIYTTFLALFGLGVFGQSIEDSFEGNGNITTWTGDDCNIDKQFSNPYKQSINTSNTVLKYEDIGGLYANVRLDANKSFSMSTHAQFSLKVYVTSNSITGVQNNQVSLKLQNGNVAAPWGDQCEIIKTIELDKWQELTFDFATDSYINMNSGSGDPLLRKDFNRVVIQINGEGNTDKVVAYIDDFYHEDTVESASVFERLVWSDEFDGEGSIDGSKWFHQTKLPLGNSWYNGEIQHYTDEDSNAYVQDGMLHLVARKETYTNQGVTKSYTSARLNSKFAFTYGRVEVRAKLPIGVGTWPAIWTLGKNIEEDGAYWEQQGFGDVPWPACGEMDIMEHWGHNQNYVSSATHTPSSFGGTINVGGQTKPTASSDFHVYALEWTEDKLVFSVDDVVHFEYNPEDKNANTWPFSAEQYILLNIAIQPSIASSFTQSDMVIDYVRVYEEGEPTSVDEWIVNTPSFYPNPVTNDLTVEVNNANNENVIAEVYNISGELVSEQQFVVDNKQVHLKGLESLNRGIYILKFNIGNQVYRLKFIKS